MATQNKNPIKMKTTITTEKHVDGELPYNDIAKAVCRLLPPDAPTDVRVTVYVYVPGGGDWSSTELDVEDHPVKFRATWTDVKEVGS